MMSSNAEKGMGNYPSSEFCDVEWWCYSHVPDCWTSCSPFTCLRYILSGNYSYMYLSVPRDAYEIEVVNLLLAKNHRSKLSGVAWCITQLRHSERHLHPQHNSSYLLSAHKSFPVVLQWLTKQVTADSEVLSYSVIALSRWSTEVKIILVPEDEMATRLLRKSEIWRGHLLVGLQCNEYHVAANYSLICASHGNWKPSGFHEIIPSDRSLKKPL